MSKPYSAALVVEGGALRGIHTAGVMDVFMRHNIYFPYVIGVSAGALNTYNYIAHQNGRSAKILLEYIRDSRYLDLKAIPNQKQSAFGFDFMFYELQEYLPFDLETFRNGGQEFVVVATDVETGEPVYFRKSTCSDIFKAGAASASLPLISPPVELDGFLCIDGGVADPIPYRKAMEECDKVVVLLTRHKGFRKRTMPFAERETAKRLYKNSPQMLETALSANDRYNDTLDALEQLENEGKIMVIRPSKEIDISLLERNTENLGALYSEGLRDGENAVQAVADYIGVTNAVLQLHDGNVPRTRKYDVNQYIDAESLTRMVSRAPTPRYTGSEAHRQFTRQIRNRIADFGLPVYADPCYFMARDAFGAELQVLGDEPVSLPCAAIPYTSTAAKHTAEAELCRLKDPNYRFLNARGKIALVHLTEQDIRPGDPFEIVYRSEETVSLPSDFGVSARADSFGFLQLAKMAGVRGVICVWDGDAPIRELLLPYAQHGVGIPCVWVDKDTGTQLDALLENGSPVVSLRTTSELTAHACCETVYCILPGSDDSGESVIVHTHTDGVNVIDENGFAALRVLLSALREKPMRRTHVFVFSAGRLRLPIMRTAVSDTTGSMRRWLSAHGDLWDGKAGHLRAAAAISVEHIGLAPTEIVFSSNTALDDVYCRAASPRENLQSVVLRACSGIFGEGQPMVAAGIPTLSFAADGLALYNTQTDMSAFSASFAMEQIQTMLDCLTMLDEMPHAAIGHVEKRSPLSAVLPRHGSKKEEADEFDNA